MILKYCEISLCSVARVALSLVHASCAISKCWTHSCHWVIVIALICAGVNQWDPDLSVTVHPYAIDIMSPAEAEPPHHLKNSAFVLPSNYETTICQNTVVVEFDSSLHVQPGDLHLTPYLPRQSTLSQATSWAWYNHSHCQNTADEEEIDVIV